MAFKTLTFLEIREELKGTNYDSDDWVDECYSWTNSNESTVKEWIDHRDKMEKEYEELQKKPGIGDMGPAVLLNVDENGDPYTND
nr:hypothetical protein [uncultured Draconibacterium sp.]